MPYIARPGGVTLVGVIIVIVGILAVIAGILGLFNADTRAGFGFLSLVLTLIIGIIYLAVAKGIFSGNSFSRFLVAIVTVVNLLVGIFHLIFVSGMRLDGLGQIIFSLIILALLYSRRASEFFAAT